VREVPPLEPWPAGERLARLGFPKNGRASPISPWGGCGLRGTRSPADAISMGDGDAGEHFRGELISHAEPALPTGSIYTALGVFPGQPEVEGRRSRNACLELKAARGIFDPPFGGGPRGSHPTWFATANASRSGRAGEPGAVRRSWWWDWARPGAMAAAVEEIGGADRAGRRRLRPRQPPGDPSRNRAPVPDDASMAGARPSRCQGLNAATRLGPDLRGRLTLTPAPVDGVTLAVISDEALLACGRIFAR
jgi:hypothetical protein